MLRLSLFGHVSLRSGSREVPIKSLKLRAMLGYIALSESLVETRERLVGLLWSESGETQARAALRQVIRELREVSADAGGGLLVTAREVGWVREAVEVDVWAVVHAAERGEVHPLLLERPRLTDELLIGLEDLDPSFRAWTLAKRHTISDRLLRALEGVLAENRGNPPQECRVAEAILNLDPTHEHACRRLMHAHVSLGDTAHALRAYKALWDLLDEDYEMEPSAATQQLVAEIKMGTLEPDLSVSGADANRPASAERPHSEAWSAPVVARREARPVLSLEPLDTRQVDADKTHLVLGFRQLLIASLVRFREWRVMDTPFSPPGGLPQPPGADYDIQLFAHQNAQAVHLTLMLKELDTGVYIWSDGFELKLDNWFESQKRVVSRIAMALNVYLSAERLRRFSEWPDISVGLFDRWLRCQTLVRTFNPQNWAQLAQQFAEIISAAPGFVPAYCGLADLNTIEHIAHPGVYRSRQREQKALELAHHAVQLDPADMHAHRCLAWADMMVGQYEQAELHMQVASELNPNDCWTLTSAALLLAFCGEAERASSLSRTALDLTPSPSRTQWAYQADILFLTGDYAGAVEAADRAQDVLWGVAAWRTAALAHLGREAEAAAEARRFLSRTRASWFGAGPATDEAIVNWLLHLYPLRRCDDWERLRDGLVAAGLPAGVATHTTSNND
jgi:DNA-binding SARP family transcriptional activator